MTDSPIARRILWAASATMLVFSVIAAAVVGAGDGGSVATTAGSPSTTVAAGDNGGTGGGDAPAAGAPAGTSGPAATNAPAATSAPTTAPKTAAQAQGQAKAPTTTAGGAPTTQPPSTFKDLGPVDDPGKTAVPAAGTYKYRYKTNEESKDATTKVEDKGAAPTGGRNLTFSLTGQGFDSVSDVAWGTDEVRISKSTFLFGGMSGECDWNPDYLQLKIALARGTQWDAQSSCTMTINNTPIPVNRKTSSKITDARKVQVAGSEVTVWVIESTDHFDAAGRAGDTTATTWFAPKLGVSVRMTGKGKATGPEGAQDFTVEMEILSLQPS